MNGRCIIVVACYNEAQRLQVAEFREYLGHSETISFLFVDDGSSDDTLAVLNQLQREVPGQIEVLHKLQNGGKGEAVREGLLHALAVPGAAYVGFWDADLATPLDAIGDLAGILKSQPEINLVFGSRVKLLGREIERRPLRHYLGRVFATCASMVLNLPVYDTQCGAKLFRATPELAHILKTPFYSRWIFDVELIARQLQRDARIGKDTRQSIYEYPLHRWRDVPGSKVRPRDFLRAAKELLVIRREYVKKR